MKQNKSLRALILTVFFAILISFLGLMNQTVESMEVANIYFDDRYDYVEDDLKDNFVPDSDYNETELADYLNNKYKDNDYVNAEDLTFNVYNTRTKTFALETAEPNFEKLYTYHNFSYVPFGQHYYYTVQYDTNHKLIFETDISFVTRSVSALFEYGLYIAIAFSALSCLVYFVSAKRKLDDEKTVKKIKRVGRIWIILSTVLLLLLNIYSSLNKDVTNIYDVSDQLVNEIEAINKMSDEEALKEYETAISDETRIEKYVEEKNTDDIKVKLLYTKSYSAINPNDNADCIFNDLNFNDDIFDNSKDILDRIEVLTNEKYLINNLLSYVLEFVMLITLYFFMLSLIDKNGNDKKAVKEPQSTTDLKKIVLLKNIADGIMSVVAMALLTSIAKDGFSHVDAESVKKITITLAGLFSLLAIVIYPYFAKNIVGKRNVLVLFMGICLLGNILCLFTGKPWFFIVGYIVLSFNESLFVSFWTTYPIEVIGEPFKGFKQIRLIADEGRIGTLFGMVAGGIIGSLFPLRVSFFFTTVIIAICFVLCTKFREDEINGDFVSKPGYIRKAVFQKGMLPLFLMIVIPYGFISYAYKVIIPLNIADLGLTTTLVSFILFFRQATIIIFKGSDRIKAFWKKYPPIYNVTVGTIFLALILLAYYLVKNIYIMLLLTLFLAFFQAKMNSQVRKLIDRVNGLNGENYAGNNLVYNTGKQLAKTIGPTISSINIAIMPIIIIIGSISYFIRYKHEEKKQTAL